MEQKYLILMQGVPGSGKSYVAQAIYYALTFDSMTETHNDSCKIYSADTHRMIAGKYVWDAKREKKVWARHQAEVLQGMAEGIPTIIIDNVNKSRKDAKFYFEKAKEFGYAIQVVRVTTQPDITLAHNAARREDRKVPEDKIRAMGAAMQDLLPMGPELDDVKDIKQQRD